MNIFLLRFTVYNIYFSQKKKKCLDVQHTHTKKQASVILNYDTKCLNFEILSHYYDIKCRHEISRNHDTSWTLTLKSWYYNYLTNLLLLQIHKNCFSNSENIFLLNFTVHNIYLKYFIARNNIFCRMGLLKFWFSIDEM